MSASTLPIRTIWVRPRATILRIVDNDPEYGVFLLTVLSGSLLGVLEMFGRMQSDEPALTVFMLVMAALGGAVKGFFVLYVGAWLLASVSGVAGGSAPSVEVRAAIAWSNAPLAVGASVLLVLGGGGLLLDLGSGFFNALAVFFSLLLVWSYALLVYCLAAVQNFSPRRSALVVLGIGAGLGLLFLAAVVSGPAGLAAALDNSFLGMAAP